MLNIPPPATSAPQGAITTHSSPQLIQQHVDSLEPVFQRRGRNPPQPACVWDRRDHPSVLTHSTVRPTLARQHGTLSTRLLAEPTCGTWYRRAPTFQPQHGTQSKTLARARHGITRKSAVHCSHSNAWEFLAPSSLSWRACELVTLSRAAVLSR